MTAAEKIAQRDAALTIANHVRIQGSRVKAQIAALSYHDGCLHLAQLLDSPVDGAAGALRIGVLMNSIHRVGPSVYEPMLRRAGIFSPQRRARDLTARQRRLLAELLRERQEVAA